MHPHIPRRPGRDLGTAATPRRLRCGLAALALLAASASCTPDADVSRPSPPPSTPVQSVQPTVTEVDIGRRALGLAIDDRGQLWAVSSGDQSVVRLDPAGETVERRVRLNRTPLRAAWWAGALWVTLAGDSVVRVDGRTGEVSEPVYVGEDPDGIVAAFRSLWVVVRSSGYVVRVDPDTGLVGESIKVGAGARRVAAGGNALWVSNERTGELVRADPQTGATTRFPGVCARTLGAPHGMLASDGLLWVACSGISQVAALDERTGVVTKRVRVDGSPDSLAPATDGNLWVSLQKGPRLALLQPRAGVVKSTWPVGPHASRTPAPAEVALTGRRVWLSSEGGDRLYGFDVTPQG